MSKAEMRALRTEIGRIWKSIEAAGATRLRPPVTSYDLATGGVGEDDPESESLFDTVLDQFFPPDALFVSLDVHDGETPGKGKAVVEGLRLLSFAEMCQYASPRLFPRSKAVAASLPLKLPFSLDFAWPVALGARGRGIVVDGDGAVFEARRGKDPERVAGTYVEWLRGLASSDERAPAKTKPSASSTKKSKQTKLTKKTAAKRTKR